MHVPPIPQTPWTKLGPSDWLKAYPHDSKSKRMIVRINRDVDNPAIWNVVEVDYGTYVCGCDTLRDAKTQADDWVKQEWGFAPE